MCILGLKERLPHRPKGVPQSWVVIINVKKRCGCLFLLKEQIITASDLYAMINVETKRSDYRKCISVKNVFNQHMYICLQCGNLAP